MLSPNPHLRSRVAVSLRFAPAGVRSRADIRQRKDKEIDSGLLRTLAQDCLYHYTAEGSSNKKIFPPEDGRWVIVRNDRESKAGPAKVKCCSHFMPNAAAFYDLRISLYDQSHTHFMLRQSHFMIELARLSSLSLPCCGI